MKQGRFRSTLVLVASGGRLTSFDRVKDVPQPLRKKLEKATQGPLAGYIIIADRKGKERIRKSGDSPISS